MKNSKITFLYLSLTFGMLYSCVDKSDDSVKPGIGINPNEEELITTVELIFSDSLSQPLDTFYFRDPDGAGGMSPSIDSILLGSNRVYQVKLNLFDESDPLDVEDIGMEIQMEADEHLFCFESTTNLELDVQLQDSDGTYPIGLLSKWSTGNTSSGLLKLTLKHQVGVKDGSCAPGDTDIEVDFLVLVQ